MRPQPPASPTCFCSVLCPLCVPSLVGLALACVLGRDLERGREWGGEGGVDLCCLLAFLLSVCPSPSLTVLSVPSLCCLSICLSLGREGKRGVFLSQTLGFHSFLRRSSVTDLCPHLPPWFPVPSLESPQLEDSVLNVLEKAFIAPASPQRVLWSAVQPLHLSLGRGPSV